MTRTLVITVAIGAASFALGRVTAPKPAPMTSPVREAALCEPAPAPAVSKSAVAAAAPAPEASPRASFNQMLDRWRQRPTAEESRERWKERAGESASMRDAQRFTPEARAARSAAISRGRAHEENFIREGLGLTAADAERVLQVQSDQARVMVDAVRSGNFDPAKFMESQNAHAEELRAVMGDEAYARYQEFKRRQAEEIDRAVASGASPFPRRPR